MHHYLCLSIIIDHYLLLTIGHGTVATTVQDQLPSDGATCVLKSTGIDAPPLGVAVNLSCCFPYPLLTNYLLLTTNY